MSAGNQVATKQRRKARKLLPTGKALLQEIRKAMSSTIAEDPEFTTAVKAASFYELESLATLWDNWSDEILRHTAQRRKLTGAAHVEEIIRTRRKWKSGGEFDFAESTNAMELTIDELDELAGFFKKWVNQIRHQLAESN